MRRCWFPKPYADFVARLRVPGGFLLAAAFVWLSNPRPRSLLVGLPLAVVGLLIRAWAAGHLAKNERLATSGPYALTRNPLYIGTLLVAAGLVIAAARWELAILFGSVFLCVYLPVIELEEQHLRKLFPEYAAYADRVAVLWPRLSADQGGEKFRWALYLRNQEYQALAGFVAGSVILAWKVYF